MKERNKEWNVLDYSLMKFDMVWFKFDANMC
jgi:hypothetical protein